MKGNKKVSPSWGVCGRLNAATKSKPISLTRLGLSQSVLRLLMVCVLVCGSISGFALKSTTHLRTYSAEPASGLVYANKDNVSVSEGSYTDISVSAGVSLNGSTDRNFYGWAKPTRGWKFNGWIGFDWAIVTGATGDAASAQGAATPKAHTGNGDVIVCRSWGGNAGNEVWRTAQATWIAAPHFTVVYKEPEGGSYSVKYSYLTIKASGSNYIFDTKTETLNLSPGSGDMKPYGLTDDDHENGYSYEADVVTLTSDATNFEGWYEDGVWKSNGTGANHSYTYEVKKNATVVGMFKSATLSTAENKIKILSTSSTADNHVDLVVNVDAIGSWSDEDFAVTKQNESGSGVISIGALDYTAGVLTIPVTYNAQGHFGEGTSVELHIAPTVSSYGNEVVVTVNGLAEEVFDYEARVLDGETVKTTGTVAEALAYINDNEWGDKTPTLQLVQKNDNQEFINATSVLRVKKSMILDLNSKVLKSTTLDNLILVQGNTASDKVNLTITDNSYLKTGEIEVKKSANAVVEAIKVADANKLTMKYIKVSAENTAVFASNANAKAYGVHITGTGNVIISKKANAEEPDVRIVAKSDHAAYGVFAEGGYATFQNVAITADAKVDAYAFHSNATSNVSDAIFTATTSIGANAYATYIDGGTAVMDRVAMTATSATTAAYGANVAGGKLIVNGGSVSSTAASDVYGVCVQSNAEANIQVKTNIEAISITGANAYGVRNFGALTMNNITVTATSAANYATAVETAASADSTIIEDGKYTAYAATGFAHGVLHQHGKLKVDGGSFEAIITTSGSGAFGARILENATIANATLYGESQGSGNKAHGIVAGQANKTITLTNCNITGKSNTSIADAIFSRANVTANGCTLVATTLGTDSVVGVYAEGGTNTLVNCSATVTSQTIKAYGVNYKDGSLSISGGIYDVKAKQATATATSDSKTYGIMIANGKTATLNDVEFIVKGTNGSFSQNVYGAFTGSGTINSTSCTYTVSAATKAYGVWGAASSTLNLQNNTISATTVSTTTAYGIYSNGEFKINGDNITATTQAYTSYTMFFDAEANGEVLSGRFKAIGVSNNKTQVVAPINTTSSASLVKVKGGLFNDIMQLRYYVPEGYDIYGVDPGATEYAEGYYYNVNDHLPYENVCHITEVNVGFPTLAEAFDYARNHSGSTYTIVMTQPYTLPAGNYSLPSNATLLVPDRVTRTTAIGTTAERQYPNEELITENRCLIFAAGANLDAYGMIEVSAKQYITNVTNIAYVLGPYGRIHLDNGSTITLNNGAKINAWGYITGAGEIRVKSGAEVREFFQIHDMAAASSITDWTSSTNKNTYKAFLMNQYYIQSIEAPTKYYYGGKLIGSLGILANATGSLGKGYADNVQLVGTTGAFFSVDVEDESAWVRKSYNPTTDRILWETNSSASLGAIDISMASYGFNSKDYVLPFTNNMTIHALSGLLNISQNVVLLPGCEVEVDKTATLHINARDLDNHDMGLYLYDKSQWSADAKPVIYSPSWENGECPRDLKAANMKDAAIYVKGKIEVDGYIYTTAGGAAIYSDDINAGTIEFNKNAAADGTLYKKYDGTGAVSVTSAKLRNGGESGPDANMTITKDNAKKDDTYAYTNIDGTGFKWTKLSTVDDCVIADETDSEHPVYYAKPQGYVAITSATEDANHLFHSVTGGRLFIIMPTEAGCQWWEVIQVGTSDVYHCATNDTYYKYSTSAQSWEEYTVEVTFYFTDPKDDAANKKKVLTVNYGAKPDASIVSNPSKNEDAAATYQFYGWKSSKTGTTYAYTAELETITEENMDGMYYLPVFTSITKKYTITFNNAKNGANVPVEVFYGEHPTYDPVKDATAQYTYYFQNWEGYEPDAELPAVTGATSYTAVWAQTVNKYTVTWKNGDEVLETDTKQPYGTATAFNGTLPTKETDDNFVYAFSGWRSSLTGQTYANGSTPTVAGETTYEAQFNTTPRYAITFANYDGTVLQKEPVTLNENPVYNGLTPGRARDLDGYFKFIGWKNSDGTDFAPNATLPVVTGKETYTAQYDYVTELYWITLHNVTGKNDPTDAYDNWRGKFGVESTPFYDPDNDDVADMPTKADGIEEGLMYEYTFSGWSPELQPVSGEAEYTALFEKEVKKYTITFKNIDGNIETQEEFEVAYGTTPEDLATLVTPEKADNYYTYAFDSWTPALETVTADAEYTASFQEGVARTFPITFDPDNGVDDPIVMNVAYGQTPTPEVPETWQDAANIYTFSGWTPAIHAVDGPAEYTAQYTPTLRTFTIRFVNYDGTELKSSTMTYGATPTAPSTNPEKPADLANMRMYTFSNWSPAIASVTGDATYTATYTESAIAVTITTSGGEPTPYKDWATAYGDRANNCTIKLYKDVTGLTAQQALDKTGLTLDLNGHTISGTCASNRAIVSTTAANITITDSSVGKTGTISGSGNVNNLVYTLYVNGGSLTINYANVSVQNTRTSSQSNAYAINLNSGSVVINDGKFKATSSRTNTSGRTLSAVYIKSGQTATIKGGYYSNSVTPATGYQCVSTSEISGYTHKVIPATYTITLDKGTYGRTNQSASVDYTATELKTFTPVTAAGYDCAGYFYEDLKVLNADGTYADENVTGYITDGKWSKAANCTLTAKWSLSSILEANDGENISVSETAEVVTTTIHTDGTLDIQGDATLTTTNLILEATSNASGQLIANANTNIHVIGHAYFDWSMNGTTGSVRRTWYAVAVPWEVDARTGITEKATGRTLVAGRDFDLIYYNGEKRASEGNVASCWEYVQWDIQGHDRQGNSRPVDNLLHPGRLYMMYFAAEGLKTVRFEKAEGADLIYLTQLNVNAYPVSAGRADTDGGWNGIANPRTYFASLSAGSATYAQVLNNGNLDEYFSGESSPVYQTINLASSSFMVGKPVFIQATGSNPVVVTKQNTAGIVNAAPRRKAAAQNAPAGIDVVYEVTISADGKPSSDNLFVQVAEDEKADKYVIGKDLSKGGVAAKRAQMWIDRYDTKLSVNTQMLVNDEATYPLVLFAPTAGDYTISNIQSTMSNEDYDLYLTLDGEAIWNLSNSAYTLSLPQGNTAEYGLRISRKKGPQVATGIDEAIVNANGEIQKVLINGKVFIIRGNNVYSVHGQLIR